MTMCASITPDSGLTLTALLDREGIAHVDFVSMDIELAEPKALAGFDIERFILDFLHRAMPAYLDTGLNWAIERLGKRPSAKGMVVTGEDLARHDRLFRAYGFVYPLLWAATRLDALVPASGYMLVASAGRRSD